MWPLLILVILSVFKTVHGQCETTNDSPDRNKPCIFPFKVNNKLKNSCTNELDFEGRYWCATRTDNNLEAVGDNWGYCPRSCPFEGQGGTKTQKPKITTTTQRTTLPPRFNRPTTTQTPAPEEENIETFSNPETESFTFHPSEIDETCGDYLGTGFIIGGEQTKRAELSYLAALGYRQKNGKIAYNCGGTLINRQYVITAAHCQHPSIRRKQVAEVVLGEWDLSKDPDCEDACRKVQRFAITPNDVLVHEDWDLKKVAINGNDIALIRLPRPAITVNEDYDQAVIPACMGWSDLDSSIKVPSTTHLVAGWGRTNNDRFDKGDNIIAGAHSKIMQKLIVPVIPTNECKSKFGDYLGIKGISEKQICAGGIKGKDSCNGDSGGPLLSQRGTDFKNTKYLVGIVSFGTYQCAEGYPGVYTSIKHYLPWIERNMETFGGSIRNQAPPKITTTTKAPITEAPVLNPETATFTYEPNEVEETCGEYLGTGFIIGGETTKQGEIPYIAALGYRNALGKINYNCGGTLINRRYVITAAHCQDLTRKTKQIAQVVLGEWDLSKDPDCDDGSCRKAQKFEITSNDVLVHEDFNVGTVVSEGNDIALIRLPRPAITVNEDFDAPVFPACIGWDSTIPVPKTTHTVAGWGRVNNNRFDKGDKDIAGAHSTIMKKLVVPVLANDECKSKYKDDAIIGKQIGQITERQICAGGNQGEDSCKGDSGGPLLSQRGTNFKNSKYLVGIVSFGTNRCARGVPGVYTSIEYYLPWIKQNMKTFGGGSNKKTGVRSNFRS